MSPISSRPSARLLARAPLAAVLLVSVIRCGDAPTQPLSPASASNALAAGGLTIAPASDTLLIGQQAPLTVYNAGVPVSKTATWTSSDTAIAKVVSTGMATAQVTARAAGLVTITAASQNKTGTSTVLVVPVPVRSVTIAPLAPSLERGDSVNFVATAKDSAGGTLSGRVVAWSLSDSTVARFGANGYTTALARGTTQVRATVEGIVSSTTLTTRVADLAVSSLSTIDSANVGDTLVIAYTIQNAGDTPNADSAIVRVGLRDAAGTVHVAQRRALTRINGGASRADTARIVIGAGIQPGSFSIVAYADCGDATGVADAARLTACLAAPGSAGRIPEVNENDNSRTGNVVLRGAELVAGAIMPLDSIFTRTTITATLNVSNAGSSTLAGFDVAAGLYDLTSGSWSAAAVTTTASLGSRQSRAIGVSVAIPAGLDPAHSYELRAFADCRDAGVPVLARIQGCFATPATAGSIGEANEANNSASRTTALSSNVARVDALPDSLYFSALGDSAAMTAAAFDRGNAAVSGVTFTWTALDPTIASVTGTMVRAVAPGTARIVSTAEGRSDTVRVRVAPTVARVVSTPATVSLGSLGETSQLAATANDRNGNPVAGAVVAWSTLDPSVASVSSTGLVTAIATGTARIVATSGAAADSTIVSVSQLAARVVATPDSALVSAFGDSTQLAAIAYDANGNAVAGSPIMWSTPDSTIVRVTPAGAAIALTNGTARVIASSAGRADTSRIVVAQQVARVLAAPDSVVLTALGASASFTASAIDRRGNVVAGAALSWSALDAGIVTVTSGTVVAQAAGRARIVVASGSAADTVLAVVVQTVASVVVTPDSSGIAVGATTTLSATARDGSGAVMTGQVPTWSSLDQGIASVSSAGVVTGVSIGTARVMASIAGRADTAIVIVNPVGYAVRWTGASSSSWSSAANWYPHVVPDSSTSAYVPAGTPNQPDLLGSTGTVGSFNLSAGATLGGGTNAQLNVHGSIDASGGMNIGGVTMRGTGMMRGVLPAITVGAAGQGIAQVSLIGRTTAPLVLLGNGMNGRLVVNGHTLATERLLIGEGGAVIETNPADSIVVQEASWFSQSGSAKSLLSAGILSVGRNFSVSGPDEMIAVSGTHKVLLDGSGQHEIAVSDTVGALQNLEVHGTVTFRQTTGIKGRMWMGTGSRATMQNTYSGALRFATALPETDLGSYEIENTTVGGTIALTRNHRFNGRLNVDGGGQLTLAGHTLDVADFTTYYGTLTMNNAADTLRARMGGQFWGIANLSAGTLVTGGMLSVNVSSPVPGAAWRVSGSHTVVLDGTQPQSFSTNDTTYMHFRNLEIRNAAGVTFNGATNVSGLLKLAPGARASGDYNGRIKVFSQLPDISQGTYDVAVTTVAGPVMATRNVSFAQGLAIDDGGQLRLGGHTITAGMFNTYRGTLTMDAAADTLRITNGASFYGRADLSAGTMIFSGSYFAAMPTVEVVPGAAWNVSGSHKLVLEGTMPQNVTLADSTVNGAQDVEVRNTAGVTFQNPTKIGGLLRLVGGGRVTGDYNGALMFRTQLPDITEGSFEVMQAVVTGNVTATSNGVFPLGLTVDGGGHLRLGGHRLEIGNFNVNRGTLTMDNPADTLVVRQGGGFYGTENLSAGTMIVQAGYMSVNLSPFVPGGSWQVSGSHKTAFAGTMPQTVFFSDTSIANFNHVEVSNGQGVTLSGGTNIYGLLQLKSGGRVSVSNYAPLRFHSQMPDVSQGIYDVQYTAIAGNVTATRNVSIQSGVMVESGGNLTLGGHTLDLAYFGVRDGTLTMNAAADSLIVRNTADLYGTANLSAGSLIVHGDLRIGNMGGRPSAFAGSGTHSTIFAGSVAQNLYLPEDGRSYFGNFRVDNAAGVTTSDSVDVRGQLMGSGNGVLRSQNGRLIKVSGGLNVAGLVLDGVSLDVTGGALTRFDNVAFQGFGGGAPLRIRHPGTAGTFAMNNISFLVPSGGGMYWIDAEDTDAQTGALRLDVSSPQWANGPANTRTTNGAVVSWRAP